MGGLKETDLVYSQVDYLVVLLAAMKEMMMDVRLVGLKVESREHMKELTLAADLVA